MEYLLSGSFSGEPQSGIGRQKYKEKIGIFAAINTSRYVSI
jgi:hypothetical protein